MQWEWMLCSGDSGILSLTPARAEVPDKDEETVYHGFNFSLTVLYTEWVRAAFL